jgi:hypothetical protein
MKKILVLVAVLYSAAAIAQSSPPAPAGSDAAKTPMVGDKPLVTVKPKGTAKKKKDATQDASTDAAKDAPAAAPKAGAKPAPGKPKSIAGRLQACMEIDDATKERLNCYDAVIPPKPNPKAKGPAKSVTECGALKEEDERLTCFNGFVGRLPKLPS